MKKAMLSHRFRENYLSSFLRFLEVPRRPVRPKAAAKLARIIPALLCSFSQVSGNASSSCPFSITSVVSVEIVSGVSCSTVAALTGVTVETEDCSVLGLAPGFSEV